MFSQIWGRGAQSRFARSTAGVCVLLWMLGSVSSLYGSLMVQRTTSHCPQEPSHLPQHGQKHCVWHCDGIDAQAATGRNPSSSADPAGHRVNAGILSLQTIAYQTGPTPRGPPVTSFNERHQNRIAGRQHLVGTLRHQEGTHHEIHQPSTDYDLVR